MADQNYANHQKFVPLFHYVAGPILILNFVYSAWTAIRQPGFDEIRGAVVAFALVLIGFFARFFALKVQDRVIRLEERLRMHELASGDLRNRINDFTPNQMVGLRFASDAELPELAAAVLRDNIQKPNEIKKLVKTWRADHARA